MQIGNPTNAYDKDPEGKPEKMASKLVKQGSKLATKVSKLVIKNSGLDDDTANALEGVTDAAENQAEAGRDASLTDRVKMATGDTAGIVGDNVDNPYVSVSVRYGRRGGGGGRGGGCRVILIFGRTEHGSCIIIVAMGTE